MNLLAYENVEPGTPDYIPKPDEPEELDEIECEDIDVC